MSLDRLEHGGLVVDLGRLDHLERQFGGRRLAGQHPVLWRQQPPIGRMVEEREQVIVVAVDLQEDARFFMQLERLLRPRKRFENLLDRSEAPGGCTRISRTSPSSSTARHKYCWRPWIVDVRESWNRVAGGIWLDPIRWTV